MMASKACFAAIDPPPVESVLPPPEILLLGCRTFTGLGELSRLKNNVEHSQDSESKYTYPSIMPQALHRSVQL